MPSSKPIAIIQKINHKDSKDSNGVQDQIQGKLRKEIQSIKSFRAQTISHTAAKLLQSCPTLCNPIDGSPPGSPIPGILQARTLEWVAISFSNVWKWKVKVKSLSRVWLLANPWTAAHQAPPSMGFSRQEYWSGVLCGLKFYFCFLLILANYLNSLWSNVLFSKIEKTIISPS